MRKYSYYRMLPVLIVAVLISAAAAEPQGFDFSFSLPVPENAAEKSYLGLSDTNRFTLDQIGSPVVMVQIFSMYCPICQREAADVNRVFDLIKAAPDLSRQIRVLGIGAGNSDFEAQFFKSNYKIEFPLFSDADFTIHKGVKEVGTPHFFVLKKMKDNRMDLVFSHSGDILDPAEFLKKIIKAAGLEVP